MRRLSKARGALIALAALAGLSLAVLPGGRTSAQQPPSLPTIVNGTATLDGAPAAGKAVVAVIAGTDCGSATAGSGGSYTVQVGGRAGGPAACDTAGATINFTVGGAAAPQTTTRDPGTLKTVNLTATTAPVATPTPTPRPALPPTGSGLASSGPNTTLWAGTLAGLALLALTGLAVARRRRA